MPDILVREATIADAVTVTEFNRALARETEGKELLPERVAAGVRAVLTDRHKGVYLVAVIDEEVVGQVLRTYEWSDWRNGQIWWLQSVYVSPGHRHRGVFRTLWTELRQQARRDPTVVGLRLYVEEHNQSACDVYGRLGMQSGGYRVLEDMFVSATEPGE